MSESAILASIRNALGRLRDVRCFRNSTGVFTDAKGHIVRYGIPSTGGGSDLLGWRTVIITPDLIGKRVAVFTAIEVKSPTGRVAPNQSVFLQVVARAGGIAGVVRSVSEAMTLCNQQPGVWPDHSQPDPVPDQPPAIPRKPATTGD